jgi:hypothetical protein
MSFLPGMFPAGAAAAAAAAGLTTLSLFASATSTTHQVTMPAGVVAGDVIVIFKTGAGIGAPATVIPTGFTNIFNVTSAVARFTAWYKIAEGSEGSTTLTLDNGTFDNICLGVFRGNKAIVAVSPQDIEAVVPSTDPADQVVTASGGIAPLIVLGADVDSFSPAAEGSIVAGGTYTLSYEIYNVGDTLADVTIGRGDAGDFNALGGFYLNCSG